MKGRFDWRSLLLALCAGVAATAFLEVGLRLLSPARIERWGGWCDGLGASTPLNHGPSPGRAVQQLGAADSYGPFAGWEYEETYDALGIKRSALRPQDGEGTRVLFMGDSFIQGYDDANTVPQRAYEWIVAHRASTDPFIVLNAGYSSYSPLIFTVQAKRLLPALHPDFLVIDVDETDLFDDAVRYRELAVRDAGGRVVAVDRSPELARLADGCARARGSAIFLQRLSALAYYRARLALHDWRERRHERLFLVAETPDAESQPALREQLQYFSSTLDELFDTLTEYLPADRILIVRHPHRWHLQNGTAGPLFTRTVGNLLAAAAARSGIAFFDSQDELAARFGQHPERYYWNGDMHFNFDGMRAYGELVGRELLRKMEGVR